MSRSIILTQKNWMRISLAAVVLLAAMVLPQLGWADHGSDHPFSQFDDPSFNSASDHYAALLAKYESGELVYHAPGRRDDTKFGASTVEAFDAESARWAAKGAYFQAQVERSIAAYSARWAAQGEFFGSGAADSARWAAIGRSFSGSGASQSDNPELAGFWRFDAKQGCTVISLEC